MRRSRQPSVVRPMICCRRRNAICPSLFRSGRDSLREYHGADGGCRDFTERAVGPVQQGFSGRDGGLAKQKAASKKPLRENEPDPKSLDHTCNYEEHLGRM